MNVQATPAEKMESAKMATTCSVVSVHRVILVTPVTLVSLAQY